MTANNIYDPLIYIPSVSDFDISNILELVNEFDRVVNVDIYIDGIRVDAKVSQTNSILTLEFFVGGIRINPLEETGTEIKVIIS